MLFHMRLQTYMHNILASFGACCWESWTWQISKLYFVRKYYAKMVNLKYFCIYNYLFLATFVSKNISLYLKNQTTNP
jgi:hypothetical protein